MFDNNELETMAKKAKEKLEKQQPKEEGKDIYADFRTDEEEVDEESENGLEEDLKIERDPRDFINQYSDENYKVALEPSEEEWEVEERDEVDSIDGPIFPNGPRLSQIQTWKKEYSEYGFFVTQILEDYFVFRTLNRYEYKQIISLDMDQLQREEMICETCVLFPNKYDWKTMFMQKAGTPSTLATIIMEKSGFTQEYSIQVI